MYDENLRVMTMIERGKPTNPGKKTLSYVYNNIVLPYYGLVIHFSDTWPGVQVPVFRKSRLLYGPSAILSNLTLGSSRAKKKFKKIQILLPFAIFLLFKFDHYQHHYQQPWRLSRDRPLLCNKPKPFCISLPIFFHCVTSVIMGSVLRTSLKQQKAASAG